MSPGTTRSIIGVVILACGLLSLFALGSGRDSADPTEAGDFVDQIVSTGTGGLPDAVQEALVEGGFLSVARSDDLTGIPPAVVRLLIAHGVVLGVPTGGDS